ncbi:RmlC-like cupin [Mollisia scopiformis]|uniref:RmlC-like cupin n=1 Tax=Mollisia scopiformis TaxID=149040 RepID=A0A194X5Z7_MOLSC|nr:RmlC-like cupin [Mollisia scopiformis]KUJ15605.1 RmlC-like cupin [Mollisia scopiformis]
MSFFFHLPPYHPLPGNMQQVVRMIGSLVAAGLFPAVMAAPAPQMNYGENTGAVGGVDPPSPTVTTTSGSLYGPSDLLGEIAKPSPISGGDSAFVSDAPLVNGQEADSDLGLYLDFNSVENPQPLRGTGGQTDPGPRTYEYEKLNPDIFAPPGTDSGDVPQAQWPLGLSHNRFGTGKQSGWARQQNTDQLPAATEMAGVDMRLAPHAYRELHWHSANEWSLMLKGSVRLSAVNENGETFIDDISAGDVWFFPAGVPHSIVRYTLVSYSPGELSVQKSSQEPPIKEYLVDLFRRAGVRSLCQESILKKF